MDESGKPFYVNKGKDKDESKTKALRIQVPPAAHYCSYSCFTTDALYYSWSYSTTDTPYYSNAYATMHAAPLLVTLQGTKINMSLSDMSRFFMEMAKKIKASTAVLLGPGPMA